MTNLSLHWSLYKAWLWAGYPGWLAHCGLVAALAFLFAVLSH